MIKTTIIVISAIISITLMLTIYNITLGTVSKVLNPNNIIGNYEAFYDRWKAFDARVAQIKSYDVVVQRSKNETALIEQEAMRQSCRDIAAKYNADSNKVNRAIFKGKEAPETLNQDKCDE